MRIGIMLRAYAEKGGIGVYTRNIVSELLNLDGNNEYVLFYQHPDHLGQFAGLPQVTERWIRGENKAVWDQIAMPRACRQENIDVLFHPKFTAPLLAPCPVVMTVHGADWFMPGQAQYYPWLDVSYMRMFMPLYFKKCARVISVSHLTTENFNKVLNLPAGKVKTIYFAPARHFHRVTDDILLEKIRGKYEIPRQFILTLTKRDGDKRKNLGNLFNAYARYYDIAKDPIPLVVGGKDCYQFRSDYDLPSSGYGGNILFPGWLAQEDLPAIYSLATLYLYPSNLEAFPIPITEAMACGTPIVTSNVNGLEEIAGEAALLVDPDDVEAIAQKITRAMDDDELRICLSRKGMDRADLFNWDRCARETLETLTGAITEQARKYGS